MYYISIYIHQRNDKSNLYQLQKYKRISILCKNIYLAIRTFKIHYELNVHVYINPTEQHGKNTKENSIYQLQMTEINGSKFSVFFDSGYGDLSRYVSNKQRSTRTN